MPTPKPSRNDTLTKALVRAHRWRRRIESGQANSITDQVSTIILGTSRSVLCASAGSLGIPVFTGRSSAA